MSASPIRLLIADDHPFFRDGLRVLLEATPDTQTVGEATDSDEVVILAAELQPDVILMDLRMPGLGGIEATRKILEKTPETGVLVVTMVEDDDSVFAAMRAGARGYLLKGADKDETLAAIRAVARGEAVFGPGIARRLTRYFSEGSPGPKTVRAPRNVFPELTDREREILALIAAGKNNAEISQTLFLSLKTVRNYVSNIFAKLQVADRAQAIVRARDAGLSQDNGKEPSAP
ncbi:MAG: response regulator transcription factor [Actinobacteria bacterium]|nr:response regulator transcription factor [Actinomycetota bacterium]